VLVLGAELGFQGCPALRLLVEVGPELIQLDSEAAHLPGEFLDLPVIGIDLGLVGSQLPAGGLGYGLGCFLYLGLLFDELLAEIGGLGFDRARSFLSGGNQLLAFGQLLLDILEIGRGSRQRELCGPQFAPGQIEFRAGYGAQFAIQEIDADGRANERSANRRQKSHNQFHSCSTFRLW
jgi:hypothetical protein